MTEKKPLNEGNTRGVIKGNTKPSTSSEQKPIKPPPSPKGKKKK